MEPMPATIGMLARVILPVFLAAVSWGCASVSATPVDFSQGVPTLEPGEGIAVFQVNTNTPLAEINATGVTMARDVSKGKHLITVTIGAGTYSWRNFVRTILDTPVKWEFHESQSYFDVEPGMVNYVGTLNIALNRGRQAGGFTFRDERWMYVEIVNRTAWTMSAIDASFPELSQAYRFRYGYGRSMRDVFLDRYYSAADTGESPDGSAGP